MMAHRNESVAGVSCRLARANPRPTHVDEQVFEFRLHHFYAFDLLHRSVANITQKERADSIPALPRSIERIVHCHSGPRAIRIDVVSIGKHWCDACACGTERGISEPRAPG